MNQPNISNVCELCHRPVDQLKPFTKQDIEALNLPYIVNYLGPAQDGRLGETWRVLDTGFQRDEPTISFECLDCLTMHPEAADRIYSAEACFQAVNNWRESVKG